jgi:hypothetical protein
MQNQHAQYAEYFDRIDGIYRRDLPNLASQILNPTQHSVGCVDQASKTEDIQFAGGGVALRRLWHGQEGHTLLYHFYAVRAGQKNLELEAHLACGYMRTQLGLNTYLGQLIEIIKLWFVMFWYNLRFGTRVRLRIDTKGSAAPYMNSRSGQTACVALILIARFFSWILPIVP